MKGIILAGGLGTRLYPLTRVVNKHLLPIYDKPMIYYPLQKLVDAGSEEILIVTGGNNGGEFLKLLGNGKEFGLRHLNYAYQEAEGGIAAALGLAEHFAGGDKIVVILGDNIFEEGIGDAVVDFGKQEKGAKLFLKEVDEPERFGVAVTEGNAVVAIEEKPQVPKSNLAVVGVYMYDAQVFEIIKDLRPSERSELEITDVNNAYIRNSVVTYHLMKGWWADAGTFASLYKANSLIASQKLTADLGYPKMLDRLYA